MHPTRRDPSALRAALSHPDPSARPRAALAAGTGPAPTLVEPLVQRCGTEPDFFVRDMLTWALTRHPAPVTVPLLLLELGAARAQARSQALHTLSKIGDRSVWPAVPRSLLTDPDDEVARTAWRTAVLLAPEDEAAELSRSLVSQFGRGGRETQLSLSRALVELGEPAVAPVRAVAEGHADPGVRAHALATERLRRDPEAGFADAVEEAKRAVSLGPDGPPGEEE